ncbi:MAG: DUF3823 domain-containing protein [Bacteroidales bacterium]|nr:DUF3823 domain-containing protein [Bacteroidales bacterium]
MKNISLIYLLLLTLLSFSSCELDNYDGPNAALSGQILDHNGNRVQTLQGGADMRLKLEELSWAKGDTTVAIIPTYLNVKQDGTYMNDKLFAGEYRITPIEGAFYPYDEEGELVTIKGRATMDFIVTPYLNVEWVTEPYLDENAYIRAAIRFTRNAKDDVAMPDLNNCQLFIARTKYCGSNNYDNQLVAAPWTITNTQEGTTIELITSRAVKYVGTTYYVRAGVSCKDAYKKYNYTDIKTVHVAHDVVLP